MLSFIGWYVKLLTAIIGWGSFLGAAVIATILLLEKRYCFGTWCALAYGVAFLTFRFFLPGLYFQLMPQLAIFLSVICICRSRHEDREKGKRWWNW